MICWRAAGASSSSTHETPRSSRTVRSSATENCRRRLGKSSFRISATVRTLASSNRLPIRGPMPQTSFHFGRSGSHQRSFRMKSTTRCARSAAATSTRRSSTWQFSTRFSARSCCDDQYGLGITPTTIEDIAKHLLEADPHVLPSGTPPPCFNRLP